MNLPISEEEKNNVLSPELNTISSNNTWLALNTFSNHAFLGVSVLLLGLTTFMINETFSSQLSNLLGGVSRQSIFESLLLSGIGMGGLAVVQETDNIYNVALSEENDQVSNNLRLEQNQLVQEQPQAVSNKSGTQLLSKQLDFKDKINDFVPVKITGKEQQILHSNVYKCKDFIGELREQIAIRMDTKQEFAQLLEKLFKQLAPCNVHAEEVKDGKVLKQSLAHYVSALEQKFNALKHQESGFDLEVAALLCDLEAHNSQEENPRLIQFEIEYKKILESQRLTANYDTIIYPSLKDKKRILIKQYNELKRDIEELLTYLCSENVYITQPEEVLVTHKSSKKLIKDKIVGYVLPCIFIVLNIITAKLISKYVPILCIWLLNKIKYLITSNPSDIIKDNTPIINNSQDVTKIQQLANNEYKKQTLLDTKQDQISLDSKYHLGLNNTLAEEFNSTLDNQVCSIPNTHYVSQDKCYDYEFDNYNSSLKQSLQNTYSTNIYNIAIGALKFIILIFFLNGVVLTLNSIHGLLFSSNKNVENTQESDEESEQSTESEEEYISIEASKEYKRTQDTDTETSFQEQGEDYKIPLQTETLSRLGSHNVHQIPNDIREVNSITSKVNIEESTITTKANNTTTDTEVNSDIKEVHFVPNTDENLVDNSLNDVKKQDVTHEQDIAIKENISDEQDVTDEQDGILFNTDEELSCINKFKAIKKDHDNKFANAIKQEFMKEILDKYDIHGNYDLLLWFSKHEKYWFETIVIELSSLYESYEKNKKIIDNKIVQISQILNEVVLRYSLPDEEFSILTKQHFAEMKIRYFSTCDFICDLHNRFEKEGELEKYNNDNYYVNEKEKEYFKNLIHQVERFEETYRKVKASELSKQVKEYVIDDLELQIYCNDQKVKKILYTLDNRMKKNR